MYGYLRRQDEEFLLYSLEENKELNSPDSIKGIVISRLDCTLFTMDDIPELPADEVHSYISYRLRSMYPGRPEDTAFEYVLKNTGEKRSAIVIVMEKAILDKYKEHGKPLYLPFSLIDGYRLYKKNSVICFVTKTWVDVLTYNKDQLISTRVSTRESDSSLDFLIPGGEALPEGIKESDMLFILSEDDYSLVKQWFKETGELAGPSFATMANTFKRNLGRKFEVFGKKKQKQTFSPHFLTILFAICIPLLSIGIFYKNLFDTRNYAEEIKGLYINIQNRAVDAGKVKSELKTLSEELEKKIERKFVSPYKLLIRLREIMGSGFTIQSLTLKNDSFYLEAVGRNPLGLMEDFRKHLDIFPEVKVDQITSVEEGEKFSLSGLYHEY